MGNNLTCNECRYRGAAVIADADDVRMTSESAASAAERLIDADRQQLSITNCMSAVSLQLSVR